MLFMTIATDMYSQWNLHTYSPADQSSVVSVTIVDRHHSPRVPKETATACIIERVPHAEGIEEEGDVVAVAHLDGPGTVAVTGEGARMARTRHRAFGVRQ